MRDTLAQAGLRGLSFRQLIFGCCVSALVGASITLVFFPVPALIAVITLVCGSLPLVLVRGRALRQQKALAKTWTEVVEHLISGLRGGVSLAGAVGARVRWGPTDAPARVR